MPAIKSTRGGKQAVSCAPLPPTQNFLKRLSDQDKRVLDKFLTEPASCVYQSKFRLVRTERELFGPDYEIGPGGISSDIVAMLAKGGKGGSAVPTLSAKGECLLFERYNYARHRIGVILESSAEGRLSAKKAREILHWGRRALQTRSEIIQLNVPLVLSMAKRSRLSGIDFNELISEGNLALIRSVEKFDVERGFKFSTYACRAILKSFSRVIMKASRYRGLFPVELNTDLEQSDFVEQKRVVVEEDCVDELKHILGSNLARLNDVERTVIRERFAVGELVFDDKSKTLEQVGLMIGVTKERVRQIQNKALQKIKLALEELLLAA